MTAKEKRILFAEAEAFASNFRKVHHEFSELRDGEGYDNGFRKNLSARANSYYKSYATIVGMMDMLGIYDEFVEQFEEANDGRDPLDLDIEEAA